MAADPRAIGTPLAAAAIGWLLAGREPAAIARQPIESRATVRQSAVT